MSTSIENRKNLFDNFDHVGVARYERGRDDLTNDNNCYDYTAKSCHRCDRIVPVAVVNLVQWKPFEF